MARIELLKDNIKNPLMTFLEKAFSEIEKQSSKKHHSTFLSGKPVLFAGTMRFEHGKITSISINSGHYKPTEKNLVQFLIVLEKQGIDLQHIVLRNQHENLMHDNAKTWLAEKMRSDTYRFFHRAEPTTDAAASDAKKAPGVK